MKTTQQKRPPRWPHEIGSTIPHSGTIPHSSTLPHSGTIPHKERVYVKVHTLFDQTGMVMPQSIIWKDGRIFQIDKVENFRPASTLEPGRTGDCYTVIIKGERKYLFFKRNTMNDHRIGRWWVEVIS